MPTQWTPDHWCRGAAGRVRRGAARSLGDITRVIDRLPRRNSLAYGVLLSVTAILFVGGVGIHLIGTSQMSCVRMIQFNGVAPQIARLAIRISCYFVERSGLAEASSKSLLRRDDGSRQKRCLCDRDGSSHLIPEP